MSNYLAIATVTSALRNLLQEALDTEIASDPHPPADLSGITVSTFRPADKGASLPHPINVYLYQVTPNAAGRNADLPTRRDGAEGALLQRPRAALTLHYLLSFSGDETTLLPQRLLGLAVRTLHSRPLLTRQNILSVKTVGSVVAKSDLDAEIDLIRFVPLPLTLEELSKLWSVLLQVPYTLSVAYQASIVFIEGAETAPSTLPVRVRNIHAVTMRRPFIERIERSGAPKLPIVAGCTVELVGTQLKGDETVLRIGEDTEVTPDPLKVTETRITFDLPASLSAGVYPLQIKQRILLGSPPVAHRGFESNVAAFALAPTITVTNQTATDISLHFDPPVGKDQRVALLLNQLDSPAGKIAAAFQFDAPAVQAVTATLVITFGKVVPGKYLVRAVVDGAESQPDVDPNPLSPTFDQIIGTPNVSLP